VGVERRRVCIVVELSDDLLNRAPIISFSAFGPSLIHEFLLPSSQTHELLVHLPRGQVKSNHAVRSAFKSALRCG
jgi:hypothetical protein